MADLFNIGLSGLRASQTNLSVTGQNITNVNTPGYSRQTAVQSAREPSFSGVGYIGNGTNITDVNRIYNEFLTSQVRTSTSINSEVTAFQTQMEEINTLLSSTATGITPGLQNFFDALQTSIEDPASLAGRQLFLSEAEGLASRFNTVHERLSTQTKFIGEQMGTLANQVSRLSTSIAGYNDAIEKAAANGAQPNDLLDARDEAVRQLSEMIGVTVVKQDNNSINVFIGSGQPLVVGKDASSLTAEAGGTDPERTELFLVSGGSKQEITSLVSGGELGGLVRYRRDVLDQAMNSVGRLALSIASEVNDQLAKGLDLNGKAGGLLFQDINSDAQVESRSTGRPTNSSVLDPVDPDKLVQAKLDIDITDTSQLTTSDYEVVFSSGTEFSVRRLSDNKIFESLSLPENPPDPSVPPPVVDGFSIVLSDPDIKPGNGDRFLLTPTRSGAGAMEAVMNQPQELGFAAPAVADASLNNRGNAKVSQPVLTAGPEPLVPADMAAFMPITITYVPDPGNPNTLQPVFTSAGGEFSPAPVVSNNKLSWSVNRTVNPGDPVYTYSFSMEMTGKPLEGDVFTVDFNEGKSDNRNALILSDLQTDAVLGKADEAVGYSFSDGYGELVQQVATHTAQARSDSEASGAVLKQTQNNRDSVSAVNLDEEAANLIKFEQYYNASAQVIQIARSVFDTLINSIR
ncbi:flagellar hook-associated protein FlgK [Halopseudomonas pelagia]|uniref:Flagellar hook-associated protein 1 n=1 Tax=Halopseudomonas pelagia TaxID=553151 RepID=A0AA91U4B6_9GAMM|nr:flagellar hook-associated protein FlgK [Halopseudomonas pelagia]PCC99791.1 flagellar hook-associated protein FlgK [Halopseudomonas pelagia]QFY56348.1 flagellar hook-associated protein FlgK [Halopseudomonas pelagia]